MKKILLVCNAGMSTSMLVAKMKKAAQADGVEVSIEAKSLADAKKEIQEANIVLLGPQIRYELENVKKLAGSVPVEAIDMRDYGMMNGEKVLKHAMEVMVCMQIITNTGSAKSSYIEAIQKAKKGDLGGAEISMNEGDDLYAQAHEVHTSLIQKEASGEKTEFSLILMHAEDQMASTEMAKVMAREFIELYREMKESR